MFSVQVKDADLQAGLKKMVRTCKEAKPLMLRFYGKIHSEVILNFRRQGAPPDIFSEAPGNTIKAWPPISEYTKSSRLAGRPTTSQVGGILQETGQLMGSMGKVRQITNTGLVYGTPSKISHVHHFGMTIKPRKAKHLALPYPGVTGRPRSYKGTFVRGKTIYRPDPNRPGRLQPLFFLKDFVVIKPRPHLTVSANLITNLAEMTWTYIETAVHK